MDHNLGLLKTTNNTPQLKHFLNLLNLPLHGSPFAHAPKLHLHNRPLSILYVIVDLYHLRIYEVLMVFTFLPHAIRNPSSFISDCCSKLGIHLNLHTKKQSEKKRQNVLGEKIPPPPYN